MSRGESLGLTVTDEALEVLVAAGLAGNAVVDIVGGDVSSKQKKREDFRVDLFIYCSPAVRLVDGWGFFPFIRERKGGESVISSVPDTAVRWQLVVYLVLAEGRDFRWCRSRNLRFVR